MSKSPSLRRIQADIRELALDPSDRYTASPLENDMFEWHFTIRGADDTDFAGGIYHGRILLPSDYPFKPPNIVFLTPSGRFETHTKVCLSFSAFHPELWQPAWGIRLILEALISFLPTPADGAIGALNWTSQERKRLAKLSQSYCCPTCGKVASLLPELKETCEKTETNRFRKEIEKLQEMQNAAHTKDETEGDENGGTSEEKESIAQPPPSVDEPDSTDANEDKVPVLTDEPSRPTEIPAQPTVEPARPRPSETERPEDSTERLAAPPADPAPILTDGLLQSAIVVLLAIIYLLGQKVFDLVEEIQSLEEMKSSL